MPPYTLSDQVSFPVSCTIGLPGTIMGSHAQLMLRVDVKRAHLQHTGQYQSIVSPQSRSRQPLPSRGCAHLVRASYAGPDRLSDLKS